MPTQDAVDLLLHPLGVDLAARHLDEEAKQNAVGEESQHLAMIDAVRFAYRILRSKS